MPKRLLAFVCLAAPILAQTPPPPRIFDAPVYQLANGVLFDASRGSLQYQYSVCERVGCRIVGWGSIQVNAASTGANLSALTAGSLSVSVCTVVLP